MNICPKISRLLSIFELKVTLVRFLFPAKNPSIKPSFRSVSKYIVCSLSSLRCLLWFIFSRKVLNYWSLKLIFSKLKLLRFDSIMKSRKIGWLIFAYNILDRCSFSSALNRHKASLKFGRLWCSLARERLNDLSRLYEAISKSVSVKYLSEIFDKAKLCKCFIYLGNLISKLIFCFSVVWSCKKLILICLIFDSRLRFWFKSWMKWSFVVTFNCKSVKLLTCLMVLNTCANISFSTFTSKLNALRRSLCSNSRICWDWSYSLLIGLKA